MLKNFILIVFCVTVLCNCATSPPPSKVTQNDLNMFRKTFEGTLLTKKLVQYDREERVINIYPLWTKPVTANYLQLTVMNADGKVRKFYDYSEEEERKNALSQYNTELTNGDEVVVDLGYIDENDPEELFETVTKKYQ